MSLKSLDVLAVGRQFADVIAIIGSIDTVLGGIDRQPLMPLATR